MDFVHQPHRNPLERPKFTFAGPLADQKGESGLVDRTQTHSLCNWNIFICKDLEDNSLWLLSQYHVFNNYWIRYLTIKSEFPTAAKN